MRYCCVESRLGLYAADAFVRVSEVRAAGSGGERRLMIRVADQRKNLLVEAHARLLMYYTDLYPDQCAPAPARLLQLSAQTYASAEPLGALPLAPRA